MVILAGLIAVQVSPTGTVSNSATAPVKPCTAAIVIVDATAVAPLIADTEVAPILKSAKSTVRPDAGTVVSVRATVSLIPELTRVRVAEAALAELKVTPAGLSPSVKEITVTGTVTE